MENMDEIKQALKTMFKAAINNEKDGDDEKGEWITIKGTHVFIPEGKTAEDVIKEKGWEQKGDSNNKEYKTGDKITFDTNWRGVNPKIQKGEIVGQEKKLGSHGDANPDYQYKVKLEDGKTILIDKEAIQEGKEKSDGNNENKHGFKKDKGYSLSDKYKNHVQFEGDKESGGYPRKIHKDLESAKKFYEYKKEGQEGAEKQNLKEKGKRGVPVRDYPVIVKNPLGDGFVVATHGLAQKHDLTEVYPVNREDKVKNGLSEIIKNCKPETKQDLKILKGLKDILEEQ